jgi:hypothetical protein
MTQFMKAAAAVLLALLVPACGKKESAPGLGGPGTNSDQITVSVQNNDVAAYNLAIREFTSGALSAEVRIAWPFAGAAGGIPAHAEASWNFHADSPVYTHSVILYSLSGAILDEHPFVKGSSQLLLVVTISGAKMGVSP